jgi:hypothetical protein
MASGKWKFYDSAKLKMLQGLIDYDSHTFKVALFTSSSNANTLTGSDELADITNQVAGANGYTTGGQIVTVTIDSSTPSAPFVDVSNPVWTASGGSITARFAVLYDDTVSGDPLIAVCLLDTTPADVTATDGNTFTIAVAAGGVFNLAGATTD